MSSSQYQPGQVLPGTVYRVVRHLATGGMGSVYEVEDVTVEKRYVLKTLHPNLVAREDLALRMRDEAKSLGRLQHPNIVDVVTAGVTTDAQKMPFYVMERLVGQNLRVVIEKMGALQLPHAYRIAIDVADALEHAHENKIVHRDVKPENIFLHRNANGTTTTKLLDFGIVRLLDRKASHTRGKFIGTLRYASPEQITGSKLGPATDIYSLGVVLFEMLCGRGPFDDAGDAYAIGAAHAGTPAPPLSRFVRGISPEVERLIASALAKNPEERPRDCFAFSSELRRLLREAEAAPQSATAVNLVTSAPPRSATEVDPTFGSGPTLEGVPPELGSTTIADEPLTARLEGSLAAPAVDAPVRPIAPTVAADGPAERPAREPAKRVVDRSAPTRESAPIGGDPRPAPNDTQMVESTTAVAEPASLVPPAPGPTPSDLAPAFLPASSGPLAGEAVVRRSDRGPFVLVGVAAVLAIVMVGGAVLAVRKQSRAPRASATPAPPAAALGTSSSLASSAAITAVAPSAAPSPPASTAAFAPSAVPPARSSSRPARGGAGPVKSASAPGPAKEVPFDP